MCFSFRNLFRDDFDKMKDEGFIVEVFDGNLGVYFSNSGLKAGLFMELNDATIIKSELKTLTLTSCYCYGTETTYGTAHITGIGGRCNN